MIPITKTTLAATAALLLVGCSSGTQTETKDEAAEKARVELQTVHVEDVPQMAEFTATVEPEASNNIAPQAPVRITQLHVEVGDHVRKGQLLATMEATQMQQAKLQLANLETDFKRTEELYNVGGVSKQSYDAMKTQIDVARTALKNLEENNQLLSPLTGIVTARNYDNGDMYSGAMPVFVVQQIRPVKLHVNVSESYFAQVRKGMPVSVRLDVYPTDTFPGTVSIPYPTIDPATRSFTVELKVQNADEKVRPGMFARATFEFGTKRNVVCSDRAIVRQTGSGDRFVYVYNNGKVEYRKVVLGQRFADRYEILSGLTEGDRVVVVGQSNLTDGKEVTPIGN
jgi:RND family efflux transporter MFP subunit